MNIHKHLSSVNIHEADGSNHISFSDTVIYVNISTNMHEFSHYFIIIDKVKGFFICHYFIQMNICIFLNSVIYNSDIYVMQTLMTMQFILITGISRQGLSI